ncbi:MAG: restriction endonuclease [Chthoniobacteraceae bacterium]
MIGRKFIAGMLLLAGLLIHRAEGIQLGDTRVEVEARYDTAPVGDRPKGIAIYRWDLWRLEIQYTEEVAHTLIYSKLDPMTDAEIDNLLAQNGGMTHWHPAASVDGRAIAWTRSDGASAAVDAGSKWHRITFHGGRMPPPVVAKAAVPAVVQSQPGKPAVVLFPAKVAMPADHTTSATAPGSPVPASDPVKREIAPKGTATPHGLLPLAMVTGWKKWGVVFIAIAAVVLLTGLKVILKLLAQPPKIKPVYAFPVDANKKARPKALLMVPALETMEWQQFELLMGEVFRRKGYAVEISPREETDGGVDLRLRKDGVLVLAQCKRYLSGKVSVGAIREFYGVMTAEKAARGIFINTSVYTQEAVNFARNEGVELLDRDGVRELIDGVTRPGENIYDIQGWIADFRAGAVILVPGS